MTTKAIFVRRLARPGVALAERIVLTRFFSPITTRFTESRLRQTRSGSKHSHLAVLWIRSIKGSFRLMCDRG